MRIVHLYNMGLEAEPRRVGKKKKKKKKKKEEKEKRKKRKFKRGPS